MTNAPALMIRLSGLLFWFDESLQASLAKAGYRPVTRTQSMFLLCLAAGENRPSRLATMLGVSRQAVSHVIAELSRRGLITLAVDPEDARGRIVEYSDGADDLRQAAHIAVSELEKLLRRRIGADAFKSLREGLAHDWGEPVVIDVPPPAPAKTAKSVKARRKPKTG
ncbi:DNA-binding MarR family transcriptional regulator [Parvibaculum indicum]|uniref:MarR family winged helix-turn-helix transcriptional regulator n=1 Tax=Parvibaculum indicum TaxID=562969 RepID=UPI00141E27C2|nr:MarR family transcriptional regulator [Parvibaculum indicum]NIJ41193.1 DNA-binding MarR family transcriptional regulator [Parvibaculum indicum]